MKKLFTEDAEQAAGPRLWPFFITPDTIWVGFSSERLIGKRSLAIC
jgi:hypothetical protein